MSRIRTNTLALATSFFATAALAFFQVKILTNYLDQVSVGVWSSVIAVGALFATLSELGLPQVLVRYGAKFDAERRLVRLGKLLRAGLAVYATAVLAVLLLLVLVGPRVAGWIGAGAVDRWLLVLGYLAMASGTLRALNNAYFRGIRRMLFVSVLEILFATVATLGYFLLRHQLSVELVLLVFLGASLLLGGAGLLVVSRLVAEAEAAAPPSAGPPVLSEVRGFWQGAAAAGVLLVAIEQLDKPILAALLTFEAVAVFHVAARLHLFARRLLYVPFQVMGPEITHKWESGRGEELRDDLQLFLKLQLAATLGILVLLAAFARPLIVLVSNREFLSGAPVLWVFTLVLPLFSLHQTHTVFLRAVGRVWFAAAADITWLVLYLGVGAMLVGPLGLPGFVGGQVVASACILAYVLAVFHGLGLPRPPVAFFVRRILLALGIWGAAVLAGQWMPLGPWWLLGSVGVGVAVAANVALVRGGFFSVREEERAVALLAGGGFTGRVARFLLRWPRGLPV